MNYLAREKLAYSWIRKETADYGYIAYAMDWRGFTKMDLPILGRMLLFDSENSLSILQASIAQVIKFITNN